MFHLAAVISKVNGKYLFYKEYWDKYPDSDPFFKFFAKYIPFVVREQENTYKIVRWDQLRLAFGNFNEVVMILGATLDTSDKLIEGYLIRAYEMLLSIFGDLTEVQNVPQNIGEFSRELELMIRVSATKDDLQKMDWTVEERHGVTQASEEVNRRNSIHSEQATKLLEQFAVEMLDGSITKYHLFLTAAVRLKDAIHYDVNVDFSTYPHPPIFELPPELHNILGDAGEALEAIQEWDPVHPPDWVDVVQELEEKVYKSETHLVEPIMEEAGVPQKGKGKATAKQLSLPDRKAPRGIPYPQDAPKAPKGIPYPQDTPAKPKEAKGVPFSSPEVPKAPAKPVPKAADVPFQAVPPAPKEEKKKKKKEVTCPNCGFIFKSKDEKTCQLCGSPRPE
jgi:hypothetical protein